MISEIAGEKITGEAPLIFLNGRTMTIATGGTMLVLSAGAHAILESGGVAMVSGPTVTSYGEWSWPSPSPGARMSPSRTAR